MMSYHEKINALLGSRICHDLINPIGAISNGLELLMMSGTPPSPELSLISESVAQANTRIRFFRIAFGASSPAQHINRSEVIDILKNLNPTGRLSFDWESDNNLARSDVKLVYLAYMCFESAMPYGGNIHIAPRNGRWMLQGKSEKIILNHDLWHNIPDPNPTADMNAAQIHFLLLGQELARQGRHPQVTLEDTSISLSF